MTPRSAVVLLSGGLDSATCLAFAKAEGFRLYALSFDYGQRHRAELSAASRLATQGGVIAHRIVTIDPTLFGHSALTDSRVPVPLRSSDAISVTYVPARNTLFLAYALAWAEVLAAADIFIGVNAVDYSGYPDCRPEYIAAFQTMANLATKSSVEGAKLRICTPLLTLSKAEIIQKGIALGVDYAATVSCYQADDTGLACGACDACHFRKRGFEAASVTDPTRYIKGGQAACGTHHQERVRLINPPIG